jgi:DNA-directed RNA polymerase specialized sigma24 family protein
MGVRAAADAPRHLPTPRKQVNYPTTEQVATRLEQYARTIAPAVALVLAAIVHTYWLGYRLGRLVHRTNDWLAQRWPTRPATSTPEPLAEIIAETKTVVLVDDVHSLRAQGLTQRAIAERLGVSRTTVRRRLAAAM